MLTGKGRSWLGGIVEPLEDLVMVMVVVIDARAESRRAKLGDDVVSGCQ